jgi:hypothetical protein
MIYSLEKSKSNIEKTRYFKKMMANEQSSEQQQILTKYILSVFNNSIVNQFPNLSFGPKGTFGPKACSGLS